MRNTSRLLAFALPFVGLAGLWGWSDYQSRQGNDWRVPIQGFDPRDLLRGHYIEFAYDWPGDEWADGEELDSGLFINQPLNRFCIEGSPPEITRIVPAESASDCTHFAKADSSSIYGDGGLRRGRLYIPQTRAKELEDKLRDRAMQGYIVVRQRADGKITPLELEFEPRTPEEMAEMAEMAEDEPPIDAEVDSDAVSDNN